MGAVTCAIAFLAVGYMLPSVDFETVLRSHTSRPDVPILAAPMHLLRRPEFWLIAAGALVTAAALRRPTAILLPMIMLLTSVAVHAVHRPWWYYYFLHIAVPLAWLCGVLVSNMRELLVRPSGLQEPTPALSSSIAKVVSLLIIVYLLAGMFSSYHSEIIKIGTLERADCEEIRMLRSHADSNDIVYTKHKRYTFAAGLSVPPSLCVLAKKRYWCGAISEQSIRDELAKLRPRFVLFRKDEADYDWQRFLDLHYQPVADTYLMVLYESKVQ